MSTVDPPPLTFVLSDAICLARTVPGPSKKYGVKVCAAFYSESIEKLTAKMIEEKDSRYPALFRGPSPFLRAYPLPVVCDIKARHSCQLRLCRNLHDKRFESWKFPNQNRSIISVEKKPVDTSEVVRFLNRYVVNSITELNNQRRSLGVLRVGSDIEPYIRDIDKDRDPLGYQLRIKIPDLTTKGGKRDIQIREWGTHEWCRKNPSDRDKAWDNLRLHDGRPTLLVVGNMTNRRTAWLVIKTFKVTQTN